MRVAVGVGVLAVGAANPAGGASAPVPQGTLVFASNRTGVFQAPSAELIAEKQHFGASRRARWFGRTS